MSEVVGAFTYLTTSRCAFAKIPMLTRVNIPFAESLGFLQLKC